MSHSRGPHLWPHPPSSLLNPSNAEIVVRIYLRNHPPGSLQRPQPQNPSSDLVAEDSNPWMSHLLEGFDLSRAARKNIFHKTHPLATSSEAASRSVGVFLRSRCRSVIMSSQETAIYGHSCWIEDLRFWIQTPTKRKIRPLKNLLRRECPISTLLKGLHGASRRKSPGVLTYSTRFTESDELTRGACRVVGVEIATHFTESDELPRGLVRVGVFVVVLVPQAGSGGIVHDHRGMRMQL